MSEPPRSETVAKEERQGGHWLSQWGENLDEVYAGTPFAEADAIDWGLLYEVNPEPWEPPSENLMMAGPDWTITLVPPGGPDPRLGRNTLDSYACIVVARLGVTSLNEARDRGAPLVRQIAALAALESRYITNQVPIWEGPLAVGEAGMIRFGDLTRSISVPVRSATAVVNEFVPYQDVAFEGLPKPVQLALYWYSHAWGRSDLVDRFSAFWWAALALVEGRSYKGVQKKRIAAYATELASRLAVGTARCEQIRETLSSAYDRRNELFHESRWEAVDEDSVIELEAVVSDLMKWEVLGA